ncbi:hypothetical protein [Streptomyces sp. NPDC101150]|uniref:hypothetical protein n=1 Tax=Streptomyces sp. NPDC101150 TaxID=3366114 RepID=UPI0037FB9828
MICLHGGADAALGEVLRGAHPGRTTAAVRIVHAPVGLPWQDLALAWTAYRRAERLGIGVTVDPLGRERDTRTDRHRGTAPDRHTGTAPAQPPEKGEGGTSAQGVWLAS